MEQSVVKMLSKRLFCQKTPLEVLRLKKTGRKAMMICLLLSSKKRSTMFSASVGWCIITCQSCTGRMTTTRAAS